MPALNAAFRGSGNARGKNPAPYGVLACVWLLWLQGLLSSALYGQAEDELVNSSWFGERVLNRRIEPEVRMHVNAPRQLQKGERRSLLVYALPNGNTIEHTIGCRMRDGLDWHYDIQHVGAQVRLLRAQQHVDPMLVAYVEAEGLSWPNWRRKQPRADQEIFDLVSSLRSELVGGDHPVTLAAHSGGGSFLWGFLEACAEIPDWVERIVFLDANYSFATPLHAEKLMHWMSTGSARRLIVLAYDDRDVTFRGKKVVGADGGTFRATRRMRDAFSKKMALAESDEGPFIRYVGLQGRLQMYVHTNPENKILHTALVGEMNGLIHALTLGTPREEKWGRFAGPRAYMPWVQPEPTKAIAVPRARRVPLRSDARLGLPPRRSDARGGTEFLRSLEALELDERENRCRQEILAGNVPEFLRELRRVRLFKEASPGNPAESGQIDVTCDYLAVGSDRDFVRIPLTPQTAQEIAFRLDCVLPTRKIVDAIDRHAEVHLKPRPMTQQRESVATFLEHNRLIEQQRQGRPLGSLVVGIKKDVVLSPRIFERAQRLAIYGWRKLDGVPIQPLTIVHWNRYVDYSHGIRLVKRMIQIDGRRESIEDILSDEAQSGLVSDEGPMNPPRYPAER